MPSCRLDDIEIAYSDRGTGPTLLLLHGFPLDKSIWDDASVFLGTRFRVIAPDLRGFGGSACDRPFTIELLADDVHHFLTAIGAAPCILGGLSMGGYVALAFAKKYQNDLRGLALIDTNPTSAVTGPDRPWR
jgi:3-oxoadipate enol-lactonase